VKKGKFIVLEGLDGCGKTTQAQRLVEHLNKNKHHCLITKEPTDEAMGVMTRQALLGNISLTSNGLALLFAADRAEHTVNEIRPTLESGVNVICDRYVYSNLAFQGTEIPQDVIYSYNSHSLLSPDLTIFIDTSLEECTRRIISTRKNFELYDGVNYARDIRARYLEAFEQYGKQMPVKIINGNQNEDEVFAELIFVVGLAMR